MILDLEHQKLKISSFKNIRTALLGWIKGFLFSVSDNDQPDVFAALQVRHKFKGLHFLVNKLFFTTALHLAPIRRYQVIRACVQSQTGHRIHVLLRSQMLNFCVNLNPQMWTFMAGICLSHWARSRVKSRISILQTQINSQVIKCSHHNSSWGAVVIFDLCLNHYGR